MYEGNEYKIPTVNVKSDTAPGGYVRINESDFDSKVHEIWTPVEVSVEEAAPIMPPAPLLPPVK